MSLRFEVQVAAFAKAVLVRQDFLMKKLALDILREAIEVSPVRTGRFQGSWRIGITSPDLSTSPERDEFQDESGRALALGKAVLAAYHGERVIWVSNNLHYAVDLENGYSSQAPAGILGPIESRLNGIIATTVAAARRSVP